MNHDQKLESILKQFPCPMVYEPMRSDGLPKKDFFEWMVARLYRLERGIKIMNEANDIINMRRERDEAGN